MHLLAPVVLALATGLIAASPYNRRLRRDKAADEQCASSCSGVQSKFKYLNDQGYVYELDSTTKIKLAKDQTETTVAQKATITFHVKAPCEFAMQLSNVHLAGAEVPATWARDLQQHALRFSFDDGLIRDICPQPEEEKWALNIKRAILSTFQNALDGQDEEGLETDVSGRCPTEYENSETNGMVQIKRTKNLVACRESHFQHGSVRSVPYNIPSKVQNTPLMESEQTCEHKIQDLPSGSRVLREAKCTETHTFQPFGKRAGPDAKIEANVQQSLTYKQLVNFDAATFVAFTDRKSLAFDHTEFETDPTENPLESAKQAAKQLCETSKDHVTRETPGLFAELVYSMRQLDEQKLKSAFETVKGDSSCADGQRFFMDGLPMCGSAACVSLMVDLINGNQLEQEKELAWYSSFALVPRPCESVLKAILPVLDRAPAAGLLGISSMVHSYCRYHDNCGANDQVQQVVRKIESRLGGQCEGEDTKAVIFALKALGNIGHVESVVPKLLRCFQKEDNPIETRLAAIDALRRQSCEVEEMEQPLMDLFQDQSQSEELRINAFIQIVRCPCPDMLDQVISQLAVETSNQVGSFVFSFLNQKRESSDPSERELSSLLRRHHLDQKFNLDFQRFSKFTELNYINEAANSGVKLASSLIYTPEGYLPRQSNLNFTVHLFGQSVNLFEVGSRSEGLELFMDELMGPDGFLSNPNNYMFGNRDKPEQHKNARVQKLHDMFNKRRPDPTSERTRLATSGYIRMFGDEVGYYSEEKYNAMEEVQQMLDVQHVLQQLAKERDMQCKRNFLFLESTTTIPMASGLPLRLAVNGSASIDVQLKSKMDFTKALSPPFDISTDFEIKPSAAIEISAMVAVQTGPVRQGVKTISRMHTSTHWEEQTRFSEGRLFSSKVTLPDEQMEILDVQVEAFAVINNQYKAHPNLGKPRKAKHCTPPQLGKVVGVQMCAEYEVTKNRAARAIVTLEKVDKQLTSYDYIVESSDQAGNRKLKIGLNTPGSAVDREMEVAFDYNQAQNTLDMNMKTPWKKIGVEAQLKALTQMTQEAKVKLTADEKQVYDMLGTFKTESPSRGITKHELVAEGKGGGQPVKLSTSVEYGQTIGKITLDIENIFSKPLHLLSHVEMQSAGGGRRRRQSANRMPKYVTKVEYSGPMVDSKLDSLVSMQKLGSFEAKFDADFQKVGSPKHNFLLDIKRVVKMPSKKVFSIHEVGKFETSLWPNAKTEIEAKFDKKNNNWDYEGMIKHDNQENRMSVKTEVKPDKLHYSIVKVKCPSLGLADYDAVVQYQNRMPKQLFYKIEVDTPGVKGIVGEVSMESRMEPRWNLDTEASLKYPGKELKASQAVTETDVGEYKVKSQFQWDNNKIDMDTDMVIKVQDKDVEYTADSTVKVTGSEEKIRLREHFKSNPRECSYHYMIKRGQETVYDLRYQVEGETGKQQKITAHAKSTLYEEIGDLDLELNGNVKPSPTQTEIDGTMKKNQKDYSSMKVIVPKFTKAADKREMKGELKWDMDTNLPKEVMGTWKMEKRPQGKHHQFNFKVARHGKSYNLDTTVEKTADHYLMNATLKRDNDPIAVVDFGMKDVLSVNGNEQDKAMDFCIKTEAPFTRRDECMRYKIKVQRQSDPSNVMELFFLAETDCKLRSLRYFIQTETSAKMEGKNYVVNTKGHVKVPGGVEWHEAMNVIVEAESYKGLIKYSDSRELIWGEPSKKMESKFNVHETSEGHKMDYSLKTPYVTLSELTYVADYSLKQGQYEENQEMNWNKDKMLRSHTIVVFKPAEAGIQMDLHSSYDAAKKLLMKFDCKKVGPFWNCKTEENLNDKYKLSAYQEQSDIRQKVGFDADLPGITKSNGFILSQIDRPNQKYLGELMYVNDGKVYKLSSNVDGNAETGTFKMQTPTQTWKTARLTAKKVGENAFELSTERNGAEQGSFAGELRTDPDNQRIRFHVTQVDSPFEFTAQNKLDGNKRSMDVEVVIMDMQGENRRTYGADLDYELEGDWLRGAKIVLKHPKRQVYYDLKQPERGRVILEMQPNVGSNRAPTKIEVWVEKSKIAQWVKVETTLTDPSLRRPAKFTCLVQSATPDCGEPGVPCEYKAVLEIDYAGQPDKVFKEMVRFATSYHPVTTNTKLRRSAVQGQIKRYELEWAMDHKASDLHCKLWATSDILVHGPLQVPMKLDAGIEGMNDKREVVQYSALLEHKLNPNRPSVSARFNTPETWVKVEVRGDLPKKQLKIFIYQDDPEPKVEATWTMDVEKKVALLEVRDDENNDVDLHASARLIDQYTAAIKVWHTENGKREDDADIKLKLDRSDLLSTKVFVRPAFHSHITQKMQKLQENAQNSAQHASLRQAFMSLNAAEKRMLADMSAEIQPCLLGWQEEHKTLADDMGPGYKEMMDNVEIYGQMTGEVFWAAMDTTSQALEQIAESMPETPAAGDYLRRVQDSAARLPHRVQEVMAPIGDYAKTTTEQVSKVQQKMIDSLQYLEQKLNVQQIRDAIRDFFKTITDNEMVEGAMEGMKKMTDGVSMDSARVWLNDFEKDYVRTKDSILQWILQYKDVLVDFATEYGLMELIDPWMKEANALSVPNVQDRVHDFIKYLRGQITSADMINDFYKQYTPTVTVNDPSKGRYEMEIPLYTKADSLQDLLENMHPSRLDAVRQNLRDRVSNVVGGAPRTLQPGDEHLGYSVWDTIHRYSPSSVIPDVTNMMPVFKSTAYLIGNQHVITFDGHVFDFQAGCEYLLARDFARGKFTVTAAFEKQGGKVVLARIMTEFRNHQISMFRDGKIEVDKVSQQLPWQKVDDLGGSVLIQVQRRGQSTVLTTYDGIEVACDAYYRVCQVTLPGRYHGQSAGLLGSNDNEPLNDLDLADGTSNKDLNKLADHWAVGGSCQANEAADDTQDSEDGACKNAFQSSSSPLRPCFHHVVAGPFHQMCLRDMSVEMRGSRQVVNALCNITAAYLKACARVGVQLTPPEQCLRCSRPTGEGDFGSGEEERVTDSQMQRQSDVVLVVEERLCLNDHKEHINQLAQHIARNDANSKFGWIGFGGEGAHYEPHVHTYDNSVQFGVQALSSLIQGMTFEPLADRNDPMKAVMMAVDKYPFRPVVQKNIVLFTCQLCNHGQLDHYELQGALLERGIVLHIVTQNDIQAGPPLFRQSPAVGFDAENLYDATGAETGDRSSLETPNDVCSVIAQETYGTVFSITWANTAAKKVAESMREEQQKNNCQICQCEAKCLAPATICTPCDVVQPASLKSGSFTGIADFFTGGTSEDSGETFI